MNFNHINYPSTTMGKFAFTAEVVCPWLRALGYENVEYVKNDNGEYIVFVDESMCETLRIDVTADSIEAIVVDVSRWVIEEHQKRI